MEAREADDELDDLDLRILSFERDSTGQTPSAKDAAIRVQFGLSSARYYQSLFALIDSPAAVRYDPLLVRRLQRLRDTRSRARLAR